MSDNLINIYIEKNKDEVISRRLLSFYDLIRAMKDCGVEIDESLVKQLISAVNINEKAELIPWISQYVYKFIEDMEMSYKKSPEEISDVEDLPYAADTPYDEDFLELLGITNPERPWEK